MADVRALLAAERQARRVQHPHATYSKTGVLSCSVCRLAIKSEALWDGHLRSANHRKNVQAASSTTLIPTPSDTLPTIPRTSLKRKIEDVDVDTDNDARGSTLGGNLKLNNPKSSNKKSRQVSFATEVSTISLPPEDTESSQDQEAHEIDSDDQRSRPSLPSQPPSNQSFLKATSEPIPTSQQIDEDEWAAFEREVAPLASSNPSSNLTSMDKNDRYSGAIISAAPISSSELQAQSQTQPSEDNKRKRQIDDAEDEREEEQQRIQDEFEVLEEMEDRVRKLRNRREALRKIQDDHYDGEDLVDGNDMDLEKRHLSSELGTTSGVINDTIIHGILEKKSVGSDPAEDDADGDQDNDENEDDEDDDDDDGDDIDDWYS